MEYPKQGEPGWEPPSGERDAFDREVRAIQEATKERQKVAIAVMAAQDATPDSNKEGE